MAFIVFVQAEKSKRERLEKEGTSKPYRSSAGELADVQKKLNKSEQDVKRLTTELDGAKSSHKEKLQGENN